MYSFYFDIADIVINIQCDIPLLVTEPFAPFLIDEKDSAYVVNVEKINKIESKECFYDEPCFSIADSDVEERYYYPDSGRKEEIYALGRYDLDNKQGYLYYLSQGLKHINESGNCFYHIAFEKILLHENRMILHSCCVQTQYGEICFSGDSGIGKSTQGDLWVQYKDAKVINGDRTILYKEDDKWMGAGSPYAGSSNVYLNEKYPLCAIVMLNQSPDNSIRRLDSAEAFIKIYRQITANIWDRGFMDKITRRIEMLVREVPIYELSCTPDERAVDLLDSTLKEVIEV